MKDFTKSCFGVGTLSLVVGTVLIVWQAWTAFHQFSQHMVSQEPATVPLLRYLVGLVLINLTALLSYYSVKKGGLSTVEACSILDYDP